LLARTYYLEEGHDEANRTARECAQAAQIRSTWARSRPATWDLGRAAGIPPCCAPRGIRRKGRF